MFTVIILHDKCYDCILNTYKNVKIDKPHQNQFLVLELKTFVV